MERRNGNDCGATAGPGDRRHRIWRLVVAAFAGGLLLAQPALVLADVYSAQTYETVFTPIGEPMTTYCARSGVVDTARNYGASYAYANGGAHSCTSPVNYLPAGWIGVKVEGFRDGVSCGVSSWYYSSQVAWGWQLWITMCSNPSGSQDFQTRSWLRYYDGGAFYFQSFGPLSPIAAY